MYRALTALLSTSLAWSAFASDVTCPPGSEQLFIMGYGSLLNAESRARSKCSVGALTSSQLHALVKSFQPRPEQEQCFARDLAMNLIPVRIGGIRRGWYSRFSHGPPDPWKTQAFFTLFTYLAAVPDEDAEMYAVIYPVSEKELNATDAREAPFLYTLSWLDPDKVELLGNESLPSCAKIRWYSYTFDQVNLVDAAAPLAQSYIDLFAGGALQLEESAGLEGLAQSILETTYGWAPFWVNDRPVPYRPQVSTEQTIPIRNLIRAVSEIDLPAPTSSVFPAEGLRPLTPEVLASIVFPGVIELRAELKAEMDENDAQLRADFRGWLRWLVIGNIVIVALVLVALAVFLTRLPTTTPPGDVPLREA